ncbi:hypothetical protein Tco_0079813 [Tanacetum coccineum]
MKTGMRPVNAAKPKDAYNDVKRNRFNAIKASTCWVWMPKIRVVDHVSKNISASVTLKRFDYIDAQGRFKWMHRLRGGMSMIKNLMQKLLLLVQKLMILLLKLKCTSEGVQQRQKIKKKGRGFPEQKTVEGLKTAGYRVTTAGSRLMLLLKRYGLGLILYRAPCAIKGVLRGLSQVEARLVEFKNNEIKFCERIRDIERDVELKDIKIENLKNELEELKKEKDNIDFKIKKFENSAKDLDCLLGTQRSIKDKTGLGLNEYTDVPPPPTQAYSPPKNDLSWTGLPEFVDDTVTDYSRPTPSINESKDVSDEQKAIWKSNSASFSEQGGTRV